MTPDQVERYKRHLLVKEIGGPGQKKLLEARVAIVGAGALGGQMALSLAASGIGTLDVFDDDLVELSNLHRQTHFAMSDIGDRKVSALQRRIASLNPDIRVNAVSERWSGKESAEGLHLILDGTDNFETRFAMNDWSLHHRIPLITGAVAGWQGQAMLVNDPKTERSPCYRCFVPETPARAGDCNDLGTLGMITAITAQHMALTAVKYLLELPVVSGDLWLLDGLSGRSRTVRLLKDPQCPACKVP